MTWDQVAASLQFYGSVTWQTRPDGPISGVSLSDETALRGYLQALYQGSATAAAILDEAVLMFGSIKIGTSLPTSPGFYAPNSPPYLAFNLETIDNLYYINSKGELVKEIPELTVIHELIHMVRGLSDPVWDQSQANSSSFDFSGDTVDLQNVISQEMGFSNNYQVSYFATLLSNDANDTRFSLLELNHSYTFDDAIDIARFGDNSGVANDVMDHTLRADNSRDLMFGFDGDDTLKGGGGADYLYGGVGNDTVEGGEGNDHLFGEDGNDILDGGAGDDQVEAGIGDDTIRLGEGRDRAYGEEGDDIIRGGAEKDFLDGGAGNDILYADDVAPDLYQAGVAVSGFYDDDLRGRGGNDILYGSARTDILWGGDGNDLLFGGGGGDICFGEGGNDIIIVGSGPQPKGASIDGGSGDDIIWLSRDASKFTLVDRGYSDKIFWNGYQLTGGTYTLIEAENIYQGREDLPEDALLGYLDEQGVIYQWGGGGSLTIRLPGQYDNPILLQEWQNGQLGIHLDVSEQQVWWANLPRSNIVNDGMNGDLANLANAYNTPGPLALPTEPLSSPAFADNPQEKYAETRLMLMAQHMSTFGISMGEWSPRAHQGHIGPQYEYFA